MAHIDINPFKLLDHFEVESNKKKINEKKMKQKRNKHRINCYQWIFYVTI